MLSDHSKNVSQYPSTTEFADRYGSYAGTVWYTGRGAVLGFVTVTLVVDAWAVAHNVIITIAAAGIHFFVSIYILVCVFRLVVPMPYSAAGDPAVAGSPPVGRGMTNNIPPSTRFVAFFG